MKTAWLAAIFLFLGFTAVKFAAAQDAAQFVSQSVPSSMRPGLSYSVSIRMLNTGTTTWISSYALGSREDSQNVDPSGNWGLAFVNLSGSVPPNSQVTFDFTITAPRAAGTYNFQWQMIHGRYGWFGDRTPNVAIAVDQLPNPFIVFTAVALQGQDGPGTGSTFRAFFLKPSLNDSGEVAFAATVNGGLTPGLFLFSQDRIITVALGGQTLPNGAKFSSFQDFAVNNSGNVAFIASFESASVLRSGLFLYSGGEIVTIALAGQRATDGTNIGQPQQLAFNDLGAIAFSTADGRIFLYSNGSTLLIAAPNPLSPFISSFSRPATNNSAGIAFVNQSTGFRGSLSNAGISFYSGDIVSTIFSGSNLSTPDINDAGTVVFYGCAAEYAAKCGIYRYSDSQALPVVVAYRESLGAPQINNSGEIAFAEGSVFNSEGMLASLTLYKNGVSTQIGRLDAPPGPPGSRFDAFGPPSLNNLGALGFIASFVRPSPDGGTTTLKGVFIASPRRSRRRP